MEQNSFVCMKKEIWWNFHVQVLLAETNGFRRQNSLTTRACAELNIVAKSLKN